VFCAGVILEWCKVVQGGSGWLGVGQAGPAAAMSEIKIRTKVPSQKYLHSLWQLFSLHFYAPTGN